ncbi:hypothetical protein PGTUg99_019403 [Puccinia graminis f. sp. tritici]|uniref:Uncharacterized protein n=1 Tax=Puccinia graminis f. sp. tritici TaxID=56615 RepID=A0A5B0NKF2_PUCGR|nr:hypothetical protein PGTUg99_019403 [Puccinia graminis f. sp. tritici]
MSEVQSPPADGIDSQAAKVLDTRKSPSQEIIKPIDPSFKDFMQATHHTLKLNITSSICVNKNNCTNGQQKKIMKNPNGMLRRMSPKNQNIKMVPNGRIIKTHAVRLGDRAELDVAVAPKCPEDLEAEVRQVKEKSSRGPSKENGESASSHSENSEDDEDEDDEDEDEEADDDEEESQDDDEEEEHRPNDKTEEHEDLDENPTVKDIQSPDTSSSKHAEASAKGLQKKQPYVRQVDLPKEKLSPADLEAKMAAMALKNAQLIEQKKAADQDAAEYREIELKSQRTFEAQRAQQQEIDAARKAAADRKLKKTQGREWDWEKTEDDWNRSRPYTDSMTNPNPGKHSWNNQRGSGSRGRPARGPHPRGRGAGRGGRGGARGHGGPESQKADQPSAHDNQSGPVQGQSASNGNDATPST